MKYILSIIMLLSVISCGKHEREPDPAFDWGSLPSSADTFRDNKLACAHKSYFLGFYSTAEVKQTLHIADKPTTGRSNALYLGNTCVLATIGTRVYESPDLQSENYYSLNVLVPIDDHRCLRENPPNGCSESSISYRVIFQRDIQSAIIGDYFKGKKMEDVIEFNYLTRELKFKLRDEVISFQISNL